MVSTLEMDLGELPVWLWALVKGEERPSKMRAKKLENKLKKKIGKEFS